VSESLLGRDEDCARVRTLLDGGGGAALLLGAPGVGKTALLARIAADVERDGTRVLSASGVQFASGVSYSGLHHLLSGVHERLDVLDREHRDALRAAIGLTTGPPPSRLLVCTAVLLLTAALAADRPLLLVVDDLPWVDRSSAAVLGFTARRLAGGRVRLLGAARTGADGASGNAGFEAANPPRHVLGPVDDQSAREIVGRCFPGLAPAVRQRVAAEAAGNPLALLELPSMLPGDDRRAVLPSVLPLTDRLERLFAARVSTIPPAGRDLLLRIALDSDGGPDAMRTAGNALELLAPAERERLVRIAPDARHVTFRHPLIRSAVVGVATTAERQRAHLALAEALHDHPERRAWHLGEAAADPDEQVATLLERSAQPATARGDPMGAILRLHRAADLSPDPAGRARRLARAAYLGAESVGEDSSADRFLEETGRSAATPLLAVTATAALQINGDGDVTTGYALLASAIETGDHGFDGRDDALTQALHTLLLLARYAGTAAAWDRYLALFARLRAPVDPDLALVTRVYADTTDPDPAVIADLDAQLTGLRREPDPHRVVRIGSAVQYLDRVSTVQNDLWRVVRQGRAGAAPARRRITALGLLGRELFHAGAWDTVAEIAEEGRALCTERGFPFPAWIFRSQQGLLAAARGEDPAGSDDLLRWAVARQAGGVERFARHALALHHIGRGDFAAAYREATTIAPPGRLPRYLPQALWAGLDLVEAAVRTGHRAEAVAHAAALRRAGATRLSSRLGLLAAGATALIADDGEARAAFGRALSPPDVARWPFDRARVRLAYGERLRRLGAVQEARTELSGAADVFRRLGAAPWRDRAENELRATGLSRPRPAAGEPPVLTAREREIAELAAAGLTNREIGARLFLSHRTVGSHLYQLFPKLGLRSRAGLRDALLRLTD
jgi:DNA-binding CsgD family transcriptional regulator